MNDFPQKIAIDWATLYLFGWSQFYVAVLADSFNLRLIQMHECFLSSTQSVTFHGVRNSLFTNNSIIVPRHWKCLSINQE